MSISHITAGGLLALLVVSGCERPDHAREHRWDREDYSSRRDDSSDDDKSDKTEVFSSEAKSVENFEHIRFRGAAQLDISVGESPAFKVDGNQKRIKDISVHGNTLVINVTKSRGWFSRDDSGDLTIHVSVPKLTELESNGAGEISIKGLQGGDQRLELSGAHDVKAQGTLDKLDLKLSGAGAVDYTKVATADVKVQVNGAGEVKVQAKDSLHAEINGVGAVRYTGNPKHVNSELHGLGTIGAMDGAASITLGSSQSGDEDDSEAKPDSVPTPPNPKAPADDSTSESAKRTGE